ncbi:MAG: hypothetical protein SGI88_16745 [Candidatus Hydrogenedentes bacterium]|nr:hypothetical protein [Candidatus Hydrogenedentota bacterium]
MKLKLFNRVVNFGAGALCAFNLTPVALAQDTFATVSGIVRYEGGVPRRDIPDNEGKYRPRLDVDRGGGLGNAVVYLDPIGDVVLSRGTATDKPVEITQDNGEFVPRVVAVRSGQRIAVTNSEPANHNVRSVTVVGENQFNVMTAFDDAYEHVIQPERLGRPIQLLCDIHPWMIGWIFVCDHDLFAVSDANGQFAMKNVPQGKYMLRVQQPHGALKAAGNVSIASSDKNTAAVIFGEKDLGAKEPVAIKIE